MRNWLARQVVQTAVTHATGFPLHIDSVQFDPFRSQVHARGIRLQNPPDFPEPLFVDMPQLYVDYTLPSLLSGGNHVRELHIHIDHLNLVKTTNGQSNVQQLRGVSSSESPARTRYRLDTLRIQVGKVTIKDYSRARPTERTITLNLDRTYRNITDQTSVTRLVLMSMLGPIPLPEFGVNTADLKRGLESVTDAAGQALGTAADALGEAGRGVVDTLKKVVPGK